MAKMAQRPSNLLHQTVMHLEAFGFCVWKVETSDNYFPDLSYLQNVVGNVHPVYNGCLRWKDRKFPDRILSIDTSVMVALQHDLCFSVTLL